jgi:hypothetical protein
VDDKPDYRTLNHPKKWLKKSCNFARIVAVIFALYVA